MKTDSGPGRLSIEADSLQFRTEMAEKGVHILLSLPNATAATAEMDQLYTKYIPRCKRSTLRVVSRKLTARAEARRRAKNEDHDDIVDEQEDIVDADVEVLGDDEVAKCGDGGGTNDVTSDSQKAKKICNVSITNLDLGNIVNGFSDDPIELRPFDYSFRRGTIVNTWKAVGFVPMTANAVNDPKVRYELGDGGAPEKVQRRMEALEKEYAVSGKKLTAIGMNGHLLDAEMPKVVKQAPISDTSEAKIQKMVDEGVVGKAGKWFKVGVCVANGKEVLEAVRRVKVKVAEEAAAKECKAQETADFVKWMALKEFVKWYGDDQKVDKDGYPLLTKKAAVAIVKLLLPRIAPDLKLNDFKTLKKCVKWLGDLAGGTTWVTEMRAVEDSYSNNEMPLRRLF